MTATGYGIEDRIGVDPIDRLLADRYAVVERMASFWGEYGPGGLAESRLSAERCRIVGLLRAKAAKDGEKVTEAALEANSRTHEDYLHLMAKQTTERAKFFTMQAELDAIDARINRGQALIRAYATEPR